MRYQIHTVVVSVDGRRGTGYAHIDSELEAGVDVKVSVSPHPMYLTREPLSALPSQEQGLLPYFLPISQLVL